jgi:putative ABC transport system permease protein
VNEVRWIGWSERWLRLLLLLYPWDFREDMGEALVDAYRDRSRTALRRQGWAGVLALWARALVDSLRNGLAERLRPAFAWRRGGSWGREAEMVVRRLVRAPVFTLSMVGTLTAGLGAFAVVYTVVHRVLVKPLPYERPDDLYYVWRDYPWVPLPRGWLAGTDVEAIRLSGGVIEGAAAIYREALTLADRGGAAPEEVYAMFTSPGFFGLLGARPQLGRVFVDGDFSEGARPAVVLTHQLWRDRFRSDPGVVGREVWLDGKSATVVGVMGESFRFVRHSSLGAPEPAGAFVALDVALAKTNPEQGTYAGIVRARPGTPPERVAAAIDAVGRRIDARRGGTGLRLYPVPMHDDLVAPVRAPLTVLAGAGVTLALMLALNLAALLLVRAAQREREFAITRALGANRLALARAMALEGALLGALGGLGGSLLAIPGVRLLGAVTPLDFPRRHELAVDLEIAAVMVGVGAVMGLLAGCVPAVWASRTRLRTLLGNAAVRGGGRSRMRRSMVVAQVALSLMLLSAGGLLARSFGALLGSHPGFDPSGVLTFRISIAASVYPGVDSMEVLHGRLHRELAGIPGAVSVGAVSGLPLTAEIDQGTVTVLRPDGRPEPTGEMSDLITIRPGYLETLRIPLLEGRMLSSAATNLREAVVDQKMAQHFFPSGSALGGRIPWGKDTLTVVGVVGHARQYDLRRDGRPQLYVYNQLDGYRTLFWVVRTEGSPYDLLPDIQTAVARVDPTLAIARAMPMEEVVGRSVLQQRFSMVLVIGFALGAVLLAAMGLYGVVSGAVSHRRHEIAVRIALGAEHRAVLRLLVRDGVRLILLGALIGLPGVWLAGRLAREILVDVSPFDPLTLGLVALALGAIAVAACYLPARRVLRIDPAQSLRQE